jgi:alpha-N-arabinofuranosidase
LREQAVERGVPDLELTYGEFNTNSMGAPGWPESGWPIVHWETVANAAFVAGMYNTFIRQGDAVRYSHLVDYTIYHRPTTDDHWPVSPAHLVTQMYSDPFRMRGVSWHNASVAIAGPTFDIPEMERMMPYAGVPYVDSACMIADHGKTAFVFAVNRDLAQHRGVALSVDGWPAGRGTSTSGPKAAARMLSSVPEDNPFAQERSWGSRTTSRLRDFTVSPGADGTLAVELPPGATIRLRVDGIGKSVLSQG